MNEWECKMSIISTLLFKYLPPLLFDCKLIQKLLKFLVLKLLEKDSSSKLNLLVVISNSQTVHGGAKNG